MGSASCSCRWTRAPTDLAADPGHRQARFAGIRWQVAAEQQAPEAQALGPVQSVMQLLPLQGSLPAQEPFPRQEIRFEPALLEMPAAHEVDPEQMVVHMFPEQLTIPWQEPMPEQVMLFMEPTAVTPLRQAFVPLQFTLKQTPPALDAPAAGAVAALNRAGGRGPGSQSCPRTRRSGR